ncbi:MAG: hypothetical protein HF962_01230, partial [Sulfurovum sp.]|nr:hypothetical protein [Sulfurovum sp.]
NALNGVCSSQPPILKVTNGDEKLKPSPDENSSFVRAGTSDTQDSHRFDCLRNNQYYYSSTSLNKEESSTELPDDIDDFQNLTGSLVEITSGTGGVDYIEQETVNIATAITYADDTADYDQSTFSYAPPTSASSGTTNIKLITVTLTSTSGAEELNKNIVLQAFSCNIGSFHYHKRVMP